MNHPDDNKDSRKSAAKDGRDAPLVSVIVPTCNRPAMLGAALRSLVDQTYAHWEAIVVNDGRESVDHIINSVGDKRVRLVCNPRNLGLAETRNAGIWESRGEIIAYLDDDDRYYPHHLQTSVAYIETNRVDCIYTDAYCAIQKKIDGAYQTVEKQLRYSSDFDYQRILWSNMLPVICLVHRKSCLAVAGNFDGSLRCLEDWDLLIRLSRHFKMHHVPAVTAEYTSRDDGTSMTGTMQAKYLETRKIIYRKYRELSKWNFRVRHKQRKSIRDMEKRLRASV